MKTEEAALTTTVAAPIGIAPRMTTALTGRAFLLVSITMLALIGRLYGISLYPFEGDEYNSIAGAYDINLNWNSLPYAVLTHFWIGFGSSELWLRLPAAIFGVASVPVLFRVGEKVGGQRSAIACALLAAVAPYSVYHSQEMRFYSLFLFASAVFLLASITKLERGKGVVSHLTMLVAGLFLVLSHFLGILALCAQAIAHAFAHPRIARRVKLLMLSGFALLVLLPLVPFVQRQLWAFYSAHAGVTDFSLPVTTAAMPISVAKLGFTFYTFVFGYHVYPLKLWLVIPGGLLFALLATVGIVKLWTTSAWRLLPAVYLLAMVAVFFVLNSAGGRVSTVIGPRHVAFAFPVFVLLVSLGLAAFPARAAKVLLGAVLLVCALSLALRWQKDWSSGSTPDYREAAAYAGKWNNQNTAFVGTGRSNGPFAAYFPPSLNRGDWDEYLQTQDISPLLAKDRIIIVSNEWMADRRHGIEKFMRQLENQYTCVDGRVDYPLFEYVFDRKTSTGKAMQPGGSAEQLPQPFSIFGLEFQDLKLPVSVTGKGATVKVIGASQIPSSAGEATLVFPSGQTAGKTRIVLFTNATLDREVPEGKAIAELIMQTKSDVVTRPLRLGIETAAWDQECGTGVACETVYRWHKRLVIAGRSSYRGAWRDFQAGIHAVTFDLPTQAQVDKISVKYIAGSGRLYIWAVAVQ